MGQTNSLPPFLNDQTIAFMQQQGLNTAELAQFYTFDPKTGTYKINQGGQEVNKNAGIGQLPYGQYVDNQGNVKRGTTPFGTNSAGQRLDVSGNVWEPDKAKRDIYGGKFIQVGEVRWERNPKGRLVKVQYGKGGKKRIVQGGGGQSKPKKKAPAAPKTPTEAAPKMLEQSVNFNTATG
jgi:hypothetical protein